jgi:TRAP-type C4-dicarboxylate transport system permease small subunit
MSDITQKLPRAVGAPLEWSLQVMKFIVTVSGFVMALTFFLVVVIRYGFEGDLYAYEEWLLTISFWGFFAGAVLASERKLHINADILGIVISDPKSRWIRQLIVLAVELIVTVAIAYWGYLMVADEISYYPRWKMTPALKIPYVVWRAGIFLAFSYMSIFAAAYLYIHIKEGVDGFEKDREIAQ